MIRSFERLLLSAQVFLDRLLSESFSLSSLIIVMIIKISHYRFQPNRLRSQTYSKLFWPKAVRPENVPFKWLWKLTIKLKKNSHFQIYFLFGGWKSFYTVEMLMSLNNKSWYGLHYITGNNICLTNGSVIPHYCGIYGHSGVINDQ